MKLSIIYEDDDYIIINKPSGVLSIPDRHNAELPSVTVFVLPKMKKPINMPQCCLKND